MKTRILISLFSISLVAILLTPAFFSCSKSGQEKQPPAETLTTGSNDSDSAVTADLQAATEQPAETAAPPTKISEPPKASTPAIREETPRKTDTNKSPGTASVKKPDAPATPKPATKPAQEKVVEKPTTTTPPPATVKKDPPDPPKPIEPVVEKPKEPTPPPVTETPKPEPPKPEPVTQPEPTAKPVPQSNAWTVPASANAKTNPVKADKSSLSIGKTLYTKHCASCHGKTGLGDGPKAAQLDTDSGDFSSAAFQRQTDGALFYKTIEGRGDMPSYKKKIPDDEDIWHLVNYMRSFK